MADATHSAAPRKVFAAFLVIHRVLTNLREAAPEQKHEQLRIAATTLGYLIGSARWTASDARELLLESALAGGHATFSLGDAITVINDGLEKGQQSPVRLGGDHE